MVSRVVRVIRSKPSHAQFRLVGLRVETAKLPPETSKINRLRVPKVSLNMRWGKCLRFVFAPPPASHGTPGGGFIRVVPCVALAQGADWHFEWHEVRRTNNPADGSR